MAYLITYRLNLFGLAFTMYFINRFSIEGEGNPVGRWMLQTGCVYAGKIGIT